MAASVVPPLRIGLGISLRSLDLCRALEEQRDFVQRGCLPVASPLGTLEKAVIKPALSVEPCGRVRRVLSVLPGNRSGIGFSCTQQRVGIDCLPGGPVRLLRLSLCDPLRVGSIPAIEFGLDVRSPIGGLGETLGLWFMVCG